MRKALLTTLLGCASCILGACSCLLVITIIMSSSNSLFSVKDVPRFVRALYLLVLILIGYGTSLYWLKRNKFERSFFLSASLFVISFFVYPIFFLF